MEEVLVSEQLELEVDALDVFIYESLRDKTDEEMLVMRSECDRIMKNAEARYAASHGTAL